MAEAQINTAVEHDSSVNKMSDSTQNQEMETSTVFVKCLKPTIDEEYLTSVFSAFGTVIKCKIALDQSGNSLGYGFVSFESNEEAKTSIDALNGTILKGKTITVLPYVKDDKEVATTLETDTLMTKVHVNNLGPDFGESDLCEMFQNCGRIKRCKIVRDINGSSKGFGFVDFKSTEAAKKAIKTLNGIEIVKGKPLYVAKYQSYSERLEEQKKRQKGREALTTLYVKNLDNSIDDEALRIEFLPYGNVTSAKVMKEDGRSKGFGFVCFSSSEDAARAIEEMNGKTLGSKPIYVALSQSKENRRVYLDPGYQQYMTAMQMHPFGAFLYPVEPLYGSYYCYPY